MLKAKPPSEPDELFSLTSALIEAFNSVFLPKFNTLLRGGNEEPVYLPSENGSPAEIRFTRDYFRSALHEIAHWCIAGAERLQLQDYGYWYRPDGRNAEEQREFFQFEVKPQALEWVFSKQCGVEFRVSVDNLDAGGTPPDEVAEFEKRVALQCEIYERLGVPARAGIFLEEVLRPLSPHDVLKKA